MATFHFDLVSPEKLLFSGEVDQVDVPGTEGDFGVLAGHAPLVSALRSGIMRVTALADLADSVEDFDREKLAERITAQEEKIKGIDGGNALDRAIERLDHY